MELVDGEDLSRRIARGVIQLDEALPLAKQIAEALEAAHEQGIIFDFPYSSAFFVSFR
jgi:eukaryotic-like serine/threonine-protein kinase